MAILSPRVKRLLEVIVWWISVSKMVMKQVLQSLEWSFGRRMRARFVWQISHIEGAMVGIGVRENVWKSEMMGESHVVAGNFFRRMHESFLRCGRVMHMVGSP